MLEGFDASGFTGGIDFNGAREAGKHYGIYRVGRGVPDVATNSSGIDINWSRNRAGSIAADLKTGGYWRFFTTTDLRTQCLRFADALDQSNGMLAPWVDIEDHGGLTPSSLTSWAIDALSMTEDFTGRRPVLYTGKNFYDTRLEYHRLSNWELAIAWQTSGKWQEYGSIFWQYYLDTYVSWAQGRVDLQKFALDTLEFQTFNNDMRYWFDEDGILHGPMVWSGKLLPEAGRQGTQPNYIGIVHTMVGYLNGTDSYFRRADIGLESTFGVGGKYDGAELDGALYQWMRIQDRADANSDANGYAASWETSDGTRYQEYWSPMQEESIAQSMAAWCHYYNRTPELIARAHSSQRGLGYHRQGIDPYRGSGDDYWSPDGGKICPGFERSDQFIQSTIPRIKAILSSLNPAPNPGPGPTPIPEDDMALNDVVGLDELGRPFTVRDALSKTFKEKHLDPDSIKAIEQRFEKKFDELSQQLYSLYGQPSWADLGVLTWADLAGKSWGKLGSES